MGQKLSKTELFAQWRAGKFVVADHGVSTGRCLWVDDATGTDAVGYGANPEAPLATLDYAIALCTANKGDTIYLMPGHSESQTADAVIATVDIAGIYIIGMGVGADRPTFSLEHANATINVTGASVTIRNIRVVSGVANCVAAITLGAAADGATIIDCEMEDGGTSGTELKVGVAITAACDDVTIRDCRFLTTTGGTITSAVTFAGTSDNTQITDCYMNGDFASAAIVGTVGAQSRLLIANNWIKVLDGEPGIELHANSLGVISRNCIETTGMGDADTAIVAADCSWFENYAVVTDGKAGEMIGAMETGSVEGKVDSVGTLVTTADGKVVSAHVVTDSTLTSAHVVSDAAIGTAHTTSNSAVDVQATAASVAESKAISVHTLTDSKVVSAHAVSDTAVGTQNTAVSVAESKAISVHALTDSKVVSAHVVTDALVETTLSTAVASADSSILSAHVITDSTLTSAHVVTDTAVGTQNTAVSVAESKAISVHVLTDSKVVSAHAVSDTAVGTQNTAVSVAESKAISVHVLTDSKVVSAHVVTDAALGVETTAVSVAESKAISVHVVSDSKVTSVGTQVTAVGNWDIRSVTKAAIALDAGGVVDVFAVNNAPVEVLALIMHTTTAVSANACDTKWQSDPTIGTGPTDMCGNVDVTAMAIGSSMYIDGPSGSVAVIGVIGTTQPEMCAIPQVVFPGGIDLVQANSNPTTGIGTAWLIYRPLAVNATVTAP